VRYESLLGLSEKGGPLHTTALLAEVERAVEAAGGWPAMEVVAVGTGPGSFTGLRVGIATARALGLSRGIPVAGVPTIDALARGGRAESGARSCLAILDARRGEVFAALYSAMGERLWGPVVVSPAELAGRAGELDDRPVGVGPGAVRFRQEFVNRGIEIPDDADPVHRVAARHICEIAAAAGVGDGDGPVAPIYLRPPDAERWRERDTLQEAG
jgi:tRNA threonylcarbamoyladenosine biosynthesis protein TsaB